MPNLKVIATLSLAIASVSIAFAGAAHADPDALSKIVIGKCLPAEQTTGKPGPCRDVDLTHHFAVLKDLVGASQFLLIPTDKVGGIESPELEQPGARNYFEDAWEARRYMDERLDRTVPRDDVGLAINSVHGRSQNQLHIHVDCMRPDVLAQLKAESASIGTSWAPLPAPLAGHPYQAMRLEQPNLSKVNAFALLANGIPSAGADMADQTLVAVGATFSDGKDGFYLLSDHVDLLHGDFGSGEELQDHACTVLKP